MPGKPEFMVVGIDSKVTWGDDGKVLFGAPGKDLVTIVDIGTDLFAMAATISYATMLAKKGGEMQNAIEMADNVSGSE